MSGQANLRLADEDFGANDRRDLIRYSSDYPELVDDIQHERRIRNDLVAALRARDDARHRRTVDLLLQAVIAVMSITALYLITSTGPYARYGWVVGFFSQPFYIAATWRARQWGMLFVAMMFCGLWARGIVTSFF